MNLVFGIARTTVDWPMGCVDVDGTSVSFPFSQDV